MMQGEGVRMENKMTIPSSDNNEVIYNIKQRWKSEELVINIYTK